MQPESQVEFLIPFMFGLCKWQHVDLTVTTTNVVGITSVQEYEDRTTIEYVYKSTATTIYAEVEEVTGEFTLSLATSLYKSDEQFPADFDKAWVWLGYSDKYVAKRSLIKCGFTKDEDYISAFRNRAGCLTDKRSDQNGAFPEEIKLSTNCLKEWGMMAGTKEGKQVRKYFLECERVAKSHNFIAKPVIKTSEAKVQLWLQEILSYTNLNFKFEVPMVRNDTFVRVDFINLSSPNHIKIYELKAHAITAQDIEEKLNLNYAGYIDAIDQRYGASPSRPLTLTFLSNLDYTMDAVKWIERNTEDGYLLLGSRYLGASHTGRKVRIRLTTFEGFLQPIVDKLFAEHYAVSPIQAQNLYRLIYTPTREQFIPQPSLALPNSR